MRICVFEDSGVSALSPLTLCHPAFDLLCGDFSLLDRHCRYFSAGEAGGFVRPILADTCRLRHPQLAVNDAGWLREATTVLVNARWLPPTGVYAGPAVPHLGLADGQIAYAVVPSEYLVECSPDALEDCLARWKGMLPHAGAGGRMIDFPWNLVEYNAATLANDYSSHTAAAKSRVRPINATVIGPPERLFIDETANVEPLVVADTTHGPVVIDRDAIVRSFSRLEGPCYVGPGAWVLGAKVRDSTLGPVCRIGGEVEASVVQGYSNKAHEGFLGHSYLGEWINLGAGTQTSDLRNDYGPVVMTVDGNRINTGLTKVGAFIGDHTKTGLNTLLNTGTTVGAFCNLLATGTFPPRVVPSFCAFSRGKLEEGSELQHLLNTAATVMKRRNCTLTEAQITFYHAMFADTAPSRRQALHEDERRRLRHSV